MLANASTSKHALLFVPWLVAVCPFGAQPVASAADYWPDGQWRRSSPEQQGIDSTQLEAVFDAVRAKHIPIHNLIVIRNGYLVLEAYFYPFSKGTVHDLASVTKSVTSTLIGIAIDQGYIKGVDQRVLDFFPGRSFANVDERKRRLTVKHLLTMTSGFCQDFRSGEEQLTRMRLTGDWVQFILDAPLVAEPGAQFAYCSCASNLLSAILTRATGMNAEAFARRHLFGPLGIKDFIWPKDPQGNSNGWGDLHMLPMDMAKLGHLFLQEGVWNGKQIVSKKWIREATSRQVDVSQRDAYGYKWWLLREPQGLYEARGRGGQRIAILPSKQLVVVLTGIARFEPGDIGAVLLPAVKSDAPLPENPSADRLLRQKLGEATRAPAPRAAPPLPALAQSISGKTLVFRDNPYGLKSMTLVFQRRGSGVVRYSFYEPMNRQSGTRETPFGLDGVPRISSTSFLHNLPVAAQGVWTGLQDFELELHMAGFNHLLRFRFHFEKDRASVRMIDEGLSDFTLEATIEGSRRQ